jgi:protein involved in polysaccharide export with SLBB domain
MSAFLRLALIFLFSFIAHLLTMAQGISVPTSNPMLADTSKANLDDIKNKYKDLSGEDLEKFKMYESVNPQLKEMSSQRSSVQSSMTASPTALPIPPITSDEDESEGNTQQQQAEAKAIIEAGNEAQETAEKIIEAVATENKELLKQVNIYGFRYFRESKTKLFSSAQDVRPPENYVLGVGDQLNIAIWGFADYNEVFTIEKEGYIQPKYVGRIYLKGLTLKNAREVIRARYSRAYMIENSQFDITLNYSRVINVNVVGEVETPGSYTIPAVNTVFNLLAFIGGPTELGSIRNIQIRRNGEVIKRFDLYKFLNDPDKQDDYFLQNNDYVYVPMSNKLVTISGAINRPYKYELLDNETFEDLLKYAGGYKPNALTNYLQIQRYIDNKAILIDVNLDSLKRIKQPLNLVNGDVIIIREIPGEARNFVDISGSINVPGRYEVKQGDRLSDIINRALGLAENAYMEEAYIFRLDPGSEGKDVIRVNLSNALSNYYSDDNLILKNQDNIRIFAKNYFIDTYSINIKGAVRKPTVIQGQKGLTLRDGILYSAGLEPHALLERAYIRRIDRRDNSQYYITVKLDTADNYKKMDEIPLFQGDEVTILSVLSFTLDKTVSISGAVNKPGVFDLWRDFNLKDIILLAGGFKEKAFLGKVMVYRTRPDFKEEVISFTIDTTDFYSQLESFKLERNDRIIVFSQSIFLTDFNFYIGGLVKNPGVYDHKENITLSDVLLLSGGFTMAAASNRIEVARISNFEDAIVNSEPTKITIDILDVSKDFLNDPVALSYLIRPYDQIYVRKIPGFDFQQRVYIEGEVVYPGTYVLKGKNERLSSLIDRAGGFTEYAFPEGTKLKRSYQDQGDVLIDMKKALRRPGSKYNYILKDGDRISIPIISDVITVRGQIDYPFTETDMKRLTGFTDTTTIDDYIQMTPEKKVSVPYTKGKRAKFYIKNYGSGFGKYAKKKDTYVIRPNGQVVGTKFALFYRAYPKVTVGSEVVVPRKTLKIKKQKINATEGLNKLNTILQATLGSVTTTLTLYLLLKRVTE